MLKKKEVKKHGQLESKLKSTEEYFTKIFNYTNDAILIVDLENEKILDANLQASSMLGYSKEELSEIPVAAIHPYEMDKFFNFSKKVFNDGSGWTNELSCLTRSGKHIPSEISASTIDLDGSKKMIALIRDISERKAAEEKIKKYSKELEELNATKDKFFSIIAHDLRSPFESLISFTDYLTNEINNLSKEEIKDTADYIHSSARKVFELLNNLLTWSIFQTGKMECRPIKVNLFETAANAVKLLRNNLSQKNIRIINKMNKNNIVFADLNMTQSIFQNLISNAIKFTKPGGQVKIHAKDKKNYIDISVTDAGIGMDPESLKKIFSIDQNTSTKGTANEQGSGLGLILVKEFVEKNGGQIKVISELGKGTTFTFTLPKG